MPKKYQAIIDLKTDDISWTEAAKRAGYIGRWTSDGRGGVKQKSSTGGGQARRRRQFDRLLFLGLLSLWSTSLPGPHFILRRARVRILSLSLFVRL